MSLSTPLRRLALLSACLLAACLLLAAPAALAQDPVSGTFLLDTELYRDLEADFGAVQIEEDGAGGLHVQVALDPEVTGRRSRVHSVFFSLTDGPEGLDVVPDEPDVVRMWMRGQPHPFFSMGAEFGAVVTMHPRHGRRHFSFWPWQRHPEPLQEVGFTLVADEPLVLMDVLGMTATWRGVATQIAVHARDVRMHRRHRGAALLGGLFEADPPEEEPPPDDGQTVPPGCFGTFDPVTGELTSIFCP